MPTCFLPLYRCCSSRWWLLKPSFPFIPFMFCSWISKLTDGTGSLPHGKTSYVTLWNITVQYRARLDKISWEIGASWSVTDINVLVVWIVSSKGFINLILDSESYLFDVRAMKSDMTSENSSPNFFLKSTDAVSLRINSREPLRSPCRLRKQRMFFTSSTNHHQTSCLIGLMSTKTCSI